MIDKPMMRNCVSREDYLDKIEKYYKEKNESLSGGVFEKDFELAVLEENCKELAKINDNLKAENEKLKRIEQKAFWWSAEFTETMHNNNIRSAWNYWCENGRKKVQ